MCRRDTFRVKSLCQNGDKFCVGEQFVRCENTGSRSRISAYAADGSVYEGEWDQETGYFLKRTIKYADGAVYEGEWKNDKYNGQGTAYYGGDENSPEADCYVGAFVDNIRNGQGTYTWSNGNIYVGEWKDGKCNGQGTFTWAEDGTKWEGTYVNDEMHGHGKSTFADGETIEGNWVHGTLNGDYVRTYPDGTVMYEKWVDGTRTEVRDKDGNVVNS